MSSQRRLFGITSSVSQPSHGIVCGRVEAREKFHRRCDLPEGAEQTISGGLQAVFVTRYQAKTCGLSASACGRLCGPVWLAKRGLQANACGMCKKSATNCVCSGDEGCRPCAPARGIETSWALCPSAGFGATGADPAPQHGALRRFMSTVIWWHLMVQVQTLRPSTGH